ncbi:DUF1330 domain-containing protein [Peterkaempfera bronchialis]|uniref:DUF1330 domain-containing protein n=1 Tax=Peterkaempfera bronchialis TaxID=2126346 RepID=A0A345SZQ5_9ACTN|nr:DUF1330 domain-containing protein [Peterkaempfera bronchialis]AXI79210.1 DUF1330 domain-containing protein [Peterkaempfera bronchialis]
MTAYAIAHLRNPQSDHPDVLEYLRRIDATLDPFGGRFAVHGAAMEVVEGDWPGTVVVIAFPDLAAARGWYASPAYREILPLRTDHIDGTAILVDGVAPGYRAAALSTAKPA